MQGRITQAAASKMQQQQQQPNPGEKVHSNKQPVSGGQEKPDRQQGKGAGDWMPEQQELRRLSRHLDHSGLCCSFYPPAVGLPPPPHWCSPSFAIVYFPHPIAPDLEVCLFVVPCRYCAWAYNTQGSPSPPLTTVYYGAKLEPGRAPVQSTCCWTGATPSGNGSSQPRGALWGVGVVGVENFLFYFYWWGSSSFLQHRQMSAYFSACSPPSWLCGVFFFKAA